MSELPVDRTRHIQRCEPMNCGPMPHDEFRKAFEKPWRFPAGTLLTLHEQRTNTIYCVGCIETLDNGSLKVYRMFIEREKDLLGNYASIIVLTCMHCGVGERAPSKVPLNDEQPTYERLYDQYRKDRDEDKHREQMRQYQMAAMQQAQAIHQQAGGQQMYDHMQRQIANMIGIAPGMLGGFGLSGGGGANSINPPNAAKNVKPMTATEVDIRHREAATKIAALHEAERQGAPQGIIEHLRHQIGKLLP